MKETLKFKLVKETKGALRYEEPAYTATQGKVDQHFIGMIYLRKAYLAKIGSVIPTELTITVEASDVPLSLDDVG